MTTVTPALEELGRSLALVTVLPFALLLACIALLPLCAAHWWERNDNKAFVVALCAAPIAYLFLFTLGDAGTHALLEKVREYASFMVLLGTLFVITGGIHVGGSLAGTPLTNTGFLALGALLANCIGTTGASVLLIRPLLRANVARKDKAHIVVFFIFVVSNCGGLLTPLGDPPLYLGYLKGVPFDWTLQLWLEWALVNGILLVLFNFWDQRVLDREELETPEALLEKVQHHTPFRIQGKRNFLFLAGVVASSYLSGLGFANGGRPWATGVQEALLLGLGVLAYCVTPGAIRRENRFGFGPIIEVSVLFAGIFVTMTPALLVLNAWGLGQRDVLGLGFGLTHPAHYFWASGALSSFLDNAPTYLTFAATSCGQHGIPLEGGYLGELVRRGPEAELTLRAISCGAVMMGANTYIGNGPNFMVKAIAEEAGVKMPGFFGYMAYSGLILLPIFGLVTLVFFS